MSGYWYVCSPYSKYADGRHAAYDEICRIMRVFRSSDIPAFSPIEHGHRIAKETGLDPLDHKIWMPVFEPIMTRAKGLVVAKMTGWEDSHGLQQEIIYFQSAKKPIKYLDPELLLLDGRSFSPERMAA